MGFVFEKLTLDRGIRNDDLLREREFKKFVALAGFGIVPLAMIGPLIDDVWHQFILFTKQHRDFCERTVGRFIGHHDAAPGHRRRELPIGIQALLRRHSRDLVRGND